MTGEQPTRHTYRIIKIMNAACDMADNTITLAGFSDIVDDVLDDVRNEYSEECGGPILFPGNSLCLISCDLKHPCCDRVGEYNGLGRKGPLRFVCPKDCTCHD